MEDTIDLLNNDTHDSIDINNFSENDNEVFMNRLRVLGFAKNIKFWSVLEIIYNCFIGVFYFWPYLACSIISYFGYRGSKTFNKKYIGWYFFGEIVKFIFKILILIFVNTTANKIITSIFLVMSLVYLNTIWRFYKNLKIIDADNLHTLQNGWSPRIVYFVY